MMRKIKNGEPVSHINQSPEGRKLYKNSYNDGDIKVYHIHQSPEERKGKVMTAEELRSFAVEVLMQEYAETGANVIKYEKIADNEADFCFVNSDGDKAINVLLVYRDEPTYDISDVDTSWLVEKYRSTGAIPRVTMANAWCISDQSENGAPAVCGGKFCFKYYSVSPLPEETNEPLENELSDIKLAVKYAESWHNLDASIVSPYLDKDFHYGSKWVFDEMPSRKEYLDYFTGKLASVKRTNSHIDIAIGRDHQNGDVAVLLYQNGNKMSLELTTKDGRITSAYMNEYDKRFKVFYPDDELYQNHGNRLLADVATSFEDYMDNMNFQEFSNLMPILDILSSLSIREGYELDAFERGSDFGSSFQAYCCKIGANVRYIPAEQPDLFDIRSRGANVHNIPAEHSKYDDSMRIDDRISWSEAKNIPDALSYFDVPFTEVGIMQAWLLDNITDFMPKWWHANYSTKHFIFSTEHLNCLFPEEGERAHIRNQVLALDSDSLLPSLTIDGNQAVLEYTYWNSWTGLVKVRTQVVKCGNSVKFMDPEEEVLVRYNCGLRF